MIKKTGSSDLGSNIPLVVYIVLKTFLTFYFGPNMSLRSISSIFRLKTPIFGLISFLIYSVVFSKTAPLLRLKSIVFRQNNYVVFIRMRAVIIFPVVLLKRGAITPLLLSQNGRYYSVVLLKRGAISPFFP